MKLQLISPVFFGYFSITTLHLLYNFFKQKNWVIFCFTYMYIIIVFERLFDCTSKLLLRFIAIHTCINIYHFAMNIIIVYSMLSFCIISLRLYQQNNAIKLNKIQRDNSYICFVCVVV